jgi:zinc transporter ZupT
MTATKPLTAIAVISVVLGILSPLIALVGIWWWAIFGMEQAVGVALAFTAAVVGVGSAAAFCAYSTL